MTPDSPQRPLWNLIDTLRLQAGSMAPPHSGRTASPALIGNATTHHSDVAPSVSALHALLRVLRNQDHYDRADQQRFAHSLWGATKSTPFEAEAESLFLAWSANHWSCDPHHDLKMWRSIKSSSLGWRHLLEWLERDFPAEYAELNGRWAREAFASAPPLTPDQLAKGQKAAAAGSQERGLQAMLRLADQLEASLRRTASQRPYLVCHDGAVLFLDSEGDRNILAGRLWSDRKVALVGNDKSSLQDLLVQRAATAPVEDVAFRWASDNQGQHLLDLGRDDGKVVVIDATGYRVSERCNLQQKFGRPAGMRSLPLPRRDPNSPGFINRLRRHIAAHAVLNPADPLDRGLQTNASLLALCLGVARQVGTMPVLLFAAPMGSGKTFAAGCLKSLLDPHELRTSISLGKDDREVMIRASTQKILVMDNVSSLRGSFADLACTLLDGSGHGSRALYTNADEHILKAKSALILTSIRDELITREDLLDRSLRIELAIPTSGRRTVDELTRAWEEDLPFLLHDFCDLLAAALRELPAVRTTVKAKDLPRLTDVGMITEAAARSMGWRDNLALEALSASRRSAVEDNLAQSPIALRLVQFLDSKKQDGRFEGTLDQLRQHLVFQDGPGDDALQSLPRFRGAFTRLLPQLAHWNIARTDLPRTSGARTFVLARTTTS